MRYDVVCALGQRRAVTGLHSLHITAAYEVSRFGWHHWRVNDLGDPDERVSVDRLDWHRALAEEMSRLVKLLVVHSLRRIAKATAVFIVGILILRSYGGFVKDLALFSEGPFKRLRIDLDAVRS